MGITYKGTHDFSGATVTGVTGTGPYDAIVASSGGDYTTLGAAITAGKTNIYVKSGTFTETGNITLPANCKITGVSYSATIISMSTYVFTTAAGSIIKDLTITGTRTTGHQVIIGGDTNLFYNVYFNHTGTNPGSAYGLIADNNVARGNIYFYACLIRPSTSNIDKQNMIGVYQQSASSIQWYFINCTFNGQSSAYKSVALSIAGSFCRFTNCMFHEFGESTDDIVTVSGAYNQFIGCIARNTNAGHFNITGFSNEFTGSEFHGSSIPLDVDGDNNHITGCYSAGAFTNAAGGDRNIISGCTFTTGLTVAGNNTIVSGCRIGADAGGGAATITVSGGATDTAISGCLVDAAVSDSGTGTVSDAVVY